MVDIIGCEALCYGVLALRMRADLRSRIAGIPFGCAGFRGKRTIDIKTDCLVIEFGRRVWPRAERRSQLATIAAAKGLLLRDEHCLLSELKIINIIYDIGWWLSCLLYRVLLEILP